jgi:hypothetical protein
MMLIPVQLTLVILNTDVFTSQSNVMIKIFAPLMLALLDPVYILQLVAMTMIHVLWILANLLQDVPILSLFVTPTKTVLVDVVELA